MYVINADGSNQVLGADPLFRWFTHGPVWSPGSTKLAFTAVTENNFEIHVINADGSGQINPTNHPADNILPAWSPDGSKIVFASTRDGNFEIYVMNSDGSGQTRLTSGRVTEIEPTPTTRLPRGQPTPVPVTRTPRPDDKVLPAWSPDGTRIAFASGEVFNDLR